MKEDHLNSFYMGDFFRDLAANTGGYFLAVEIVLGQGGEIGLIDAGIELILVGRVCKVIMACSEIVPLGNSHRGGIKFGLLSYL